MGDVSWAGRAVQALLPHAGCSLWQQESKELGLLLEHGANTKAAAPLTEASQPTYVLAAKLGHLCALRGMLAGGACPTHPLAHAVPALGLVY